MAIKLNKRDDNDHKLSLLFLLTSNIYFLEYGALS